MGDPQGTLAAYHEVLGVLSCRTPASTMDAVAYSLRTSHAVRGLPPEQVASIETMTYGCRVAEVMTICLTTPTMNDLCLALQAERKHVGELYEEELVIERLRLEQADRDAGVPPPVPPRQATRPPPAAAPAAAAAGLPGPAAAAAAPRAAASPGLPGPGEAGASACRPVEAAAARLPQGAPHSRTGG